MGTRDHKLYSELLHLIAQKPCFHQLRTVEQLGYIVWSGADTRLDVYGFRVQVQSGSHSAAYVQTRILAWLQQFQKIISKISDKDFHTYVETLSSLKQERPTSLSATTYYYWDEISSQQYQFFRREHEVDLLNATITLAGFRSYFEKLFSYHLKPETTLPPLPPLPQLRRPGVPAPLPAAKPLNHTRPRMYGVADTLGIHTIPAGGVLSLRVEAGPRTKNDVTSLDGVKAHVIRSNTTNTHINVTGPATVAHHGAKQTFPVTNKLPKADIKQETTTKSTPAPAASTSATKSKKKKTSATPATPTPSAKAVPATENKQVKVVGQKTAKSESASKTPRFAKAEAEAETETEADSAIETENESQAETETGSEVDSVMGGSMFSSTQSEAEADAEFEADATAVAEAELNEATLIMNQANADTEVKAEVARKPVALTTEDDASVKVASKKAIGTLTLNVAAMFADPVVAQSSSTNANNAGSEAGSNSASISLDVTNLMQVAEKFGARRRRLALLKAAAAPASAPAASQVSSDQEQKSIVTTDTPTPAPAAAVVGPGAVPPSNVTEIVVPQVYDHAGDGAIDFSIVTRGHELHPRVPPYSSIQYPRSNRSITVIPTYSIRYTTRFVRRLYVVLS